MAKYLDQTGLTYFWNKLKGWVNSHDHPVGSVYITISSTFNPADQWGGRWSKIAEGQCLIQSGSTYTLGSTGGEASHYLTIDEIPSHDHVLSDWAMSWKMNGNKGEVNLGVSATSEAWTNNRGYFKSQTSKATGGRQPHNNMQPYLAVNIWKRTA